MNRWDLIQRGLFPETLPPAFTTIHLKRAFQGLVRNLTAKELNNRPTDYIRYSGTKHDGSRRYFGTPNPISYFYVSDFIAANWPEFERRFAETSYSVSHPKIANKADERPIVIPSLSQLTTAASKRIGYSPIVLRTDIAQFFPSIYTHSIPWSAHGIDTAKADTQKDSKTVYFNRLDFYVRSCQRSETRGLLVGPDAFRLIAEFIVCGLDAELKAATEDIVIGAARHVDDYYIGLKTQPAALAALSQLREVLQKYRLNLNDTKTKVINGLQPLNDLWALDLRYEASRLSSWGENEEQIILILNKGLSQAAQLQSDSPVKIVLRAFDRIKLYTKSSWSTVEPYLQRIIFHHPHCIDYVALLVTKRVAIEKDIDQEGWKAASYELLTRHLALNHHHEIVWLTWLLLSCGIELSEQLVAQLCKNSNAHIRALVLGGFAEKKIDKRPPLKFGAKLNSTDDQWLVNLVARATGFTKAPFSGSLAAEFEHLVAKRVRLIDIRAHMAAIKVRGAMAISNTRYGYDSDEDEDELSATSSEDIFAMLNPDQAGDEPERKDELKKIGVRIGSARRSIR